MFDFGRRKKHEDAKRILQRHMDRFFMKQIDDKDRQYKRSQFNQVVTIIPFDRVGQLIVNDSYPGLAKDICQNGLSLIQTLPIGVRHVGIGLPEFPSLSVMRCQVQHSSNLGYGFYQIGLQPIELINMEAYQAKELQERMSRFAEISAPATL